MHLKPKSKIWKKPSNVKNLHISRGSQRLGGRMFGDVRIGRLKFKDGKTHRVAIKFFNPASRGIFSDKPAKMYQQTINDLRKTGVRLPKMAMVKLQSGEWVLVSQLFGSTKKGSKLGNKELGLSVNTHNGRISAVEELVKVANAGYCPQWDLIEEFKVAEKGVIPIDLDLIFFKGKLALKERALMLYDLVAEVASTSRSAEETEHYVQTAIKTANPELKKELKRLFGY